MCTFTFEHLQILILYFSIFVFYFTRVSGLWLHILNELIINNTLSCYDAIYATDICVTYILPPVCSCLSYIYTTFIIFLSINRCIKHKNQFLSSKAKAMFCLLHPCALPHSWQVSWHTSLLLTAVTTHLLVICYTNRSGTGSQGILEFSKSGL